MGSGRHKRPTKAEHEQRVAEVAELLLSRVAKTSIVRFGAQRWDAGVRTMERYMVAARAQIRERGRYEFDDELATALCSYEFIYAKQLAKGDLRGARQTLDRIVDLLGLADDEKRAEEEMSAVDLYLASQKGERPALEGGGGEWAGADEQR